MFRQFRTTPIILSLSFTCFCSAAFADSRLPSEVNKSHSSSNPPLQPEVVSLRSLASDATSNTLNYEKIKEAHAKEATQKLDTLKDKPVDDILKEFKHRDIESVLKDPKAPVTDPVLKKAFEDKPDLRSELAAKYKMQKDPAGAVEEISALTKSGAAPKGKYQQVLKAEAQKLYNDSKNKALVDAITKRNGEDPLVTATRLNYLSSLKASPDSAAQNKLGEEMARMMVSMGDRGSLHSLITNPNGAFSNHPLQPVLQSALHWASGGYQDALNSTPHEKLLSSIENSKGLSLPKGQSFETEKAFLDSWKGHQSYIQEFHQTLAAAKSGNQQAIKTLQEDPKYANFNVNWAGSALHGNTEALWLAGGGQFDTEGKAAGTFTHTVKSKFGQIEVTADKPEELNYLFEKSKQGSSFTHIIKDSAEKVQAQRLQNLVTNLWKNYQPSTAEKSPKKEVVTATTKKPTTTPSSYSAWFKWATTLKSTTSNKKPNQNAKIKEDIEWALREKQKNN